MATLRQHLATQIGTVAVSMIVAASTPGGCAPIGGPGGRGTPNPPVNAQPSGTPTAQDLTIAFIGDQGVNQGSRDVLDLIRTEGADAVIHSGDFDYNDDPQAWTDQIDAVLGADFPYFASPGNHDEDAWDGGGGYRERLEERMRRIGVDWGGFLGEESTHYFGGLQIILVGPGVTAGGSQNADYIRDELARDGSIWSVVSFHKNQRKMQLGGKSDETGWAVYDESRRGGAIVATGHEHSYSRTHQLSNVENQTVSSTANAFDISDDDPNTPDDDGRTFVFVSGLGGQGIRDQERGGPWWASEYTSDQGAKLGALFGKFHVNGDPREAHFYFKNVDGVIIDEFFVRSTND